jgi:hypothetical protein
MIAKWPCKEKEILLSLSSSLSNPILKTIDFLQLWYHVMSFMSWHEYARHSCCEDKKKKLNFLISKIMMSCDIIHIMTRILKWQRENKWILKKKIQISEISFYINSDIIEFAMWIICCDVMQCNKFFNNLKNVLKIHYSHICVVGLVWFLGCWVSRKKGYVRKFIKL